LRLNYEAVEGQIGTRGACSGPGSERVGPWKTAFKLTHKLDRLMVWTILVFTDAAFLAEFAVRDLRLLDMLVVVLNVRHCTVSKAQRI
jgi:hypothetical protein